MRQSMFAAAMLLLAGCGGGGGSDGGGGVRLPTNNAPVFGGGTLTLAENKTSLALTASDPDGDPLSFTVSGGPDAAVFTMSGPQLTFRTPPNFEAPVDSDRDNVYRVTVTVSDGKASVSGDYAVTVTNDAEGIAVRRIGNIGAAWVGGAVTPAGTFRLMTEQDAYVLEPGSDTPKRAFGWYELDPNRGRFTAVGPAGSTVLARLKNGLLGLYNVDIYYREQRDGLDTSWSAPLVAVPYDPQVRDVGGALGRCANGNLCIAFGSIGKAADATSDFYGALVESVPNPDPYAGASVSFATPVVRASGLRLPMAMARGIESDGFFNLLILDQGSAHFDEVSRYVSGSGLSFGYPWKEGSHILSAGGVSLTDPELLVARGSTSRQSMGLTAMSAYNGPNSSLIGKVLVADRDGRVFTSTTTLLANGLMDGAEHLEDRTLDFRPDSGSLGHVVAIISGGSRTLLLNREGDLFVID